MKSNKNFLFIALSLFLIGIIVAGLIFIFGFVENSSSNETTDENVITESRNYKGDVWKNFDFANYAYKDTSELISENTIAGTNSVMQNADQYYDFDGDGKEEAIVPVQSGGTAGVIGILVLSKNDKDDVVELGSFSVYHGDAFVRDGKLVISAVDQWVFTPNCCQESFKEAVYSFQAGDFILEDEYTTRLADGSEGYVDAPKFFNSATDFPDICRKVIYQDVGATDSSTNIEILESDSTGNSTCPLAYRINNFKFYFNKDAEITKESADKEIIGKQGFSYLCKVSKAESGNYQISCDWYENDKYIGQITYEYEGQENDIFAIMELSKISEFPRTEFFRNIQKY